ncbi:ATG3 enzyme, partial [Crocuta crocuta]
HLSGERTCKEQLYVKRYSSHTVPAGSSFELECPVKYCTKKPHVTWCKLEGKNCLLLGYKLLGYMNWKENESISIFVLHFNRILARDTGSYRCSASFASGVIESHSIIINVTDATGASGPPSLEVMEDKQWMLYSLLSLGALPLFVTCLYLFFCLRRHQGGFYLSSAALCHTFGGHEETDVGIRQNPQTLLSETGPYDNDPWFRVQEESEVYSNPCLEENKQGVVYASLNHSVIGINPRQARNVKEAPTEYAAICVRS